MSLPWYLQKHSIEGHVLFLDQYQLYEYYFHSVEMNRTGFVGDQLS
ncbi:hypothetical protein [Acinetobacter sp. 226]